MANGSINFDISHIISRLHEVERAKFLSARLHQFEKAAPELYDFHMQYCLPYSVTSFTWLTCSTEFLNAFPEHKEEVNYYFDQPLLFIVGDLRPEERSDSLLRVITANVPLPADELNDDDDDDRSSDDDDINVEESDVGSDTSSGSSVDIQCGSVDAIQEVTLIHHNGNVTAMDAYPNNGHFISTFSDNGHIYLFDLNELYGKSNEIDAESGCLRLQFDGHAQIGYTLCWSKSQLGLLASGALDKCVSLWDVSSQQSAPVSTYPAHSSAVTSVQCHPSDPNLILSADDVGCLYQWDRRSANKHAPVSKKRIHACDITALRWHPSPAIGLLATASEDMTVKVFDVRNLDSPLYSLMHDAGVNSIAWHPHRSHIIASGTLMPDATMSLWDLATYDACQRETNRFRPHHLFQDGLLKDNVSDMKWHESREDVVGIVTEDGYMTMYKPQGEMFSRNQHQVNNSS